jgi:septum formation protein
VDIILGSASPRRKEILDFFSLSYRQVASRFDESTIPYEGNPFSYATKLALAKAQTLQKEFPNSIILSADTIVCIDDIILGKPRDDAEMLQMLLTLSNRWHSVVTGVVALSPTTTATGAEETRVLCNNVTPDELHRYMRKHTLTDKAGGYAIQKSGSLLVKQIDGCYYNVCGLPINTLSYVLKQVGVDLWDHLKDFE